MSGVLWFNSAMPDTAYLSNFYPAPIDYQGFLWPTAEHAYQGSKTLDPVARAAIAQAPTPQAAKQLGRKVPLRDDWQQLSVEFMKLITYYKFQSHPRLKALLLATGDAELLHWCPWGDRFWGIDKTGHGLNVQGLVLMRYRDEQLRLQRR